MDELRSAHLGLEHANRRLLELERAISAFMDSDPQTTLTEPSADGTEQIYKVKLTEPLPDVLSGIAFDVVSNLRAALDRATFAVALASGKTSRINSHFPFAESFAELNGKCGKGGVEDLPKVVFDEIVAVLQPYKGGNDALWSVNALCNTYKHEILVPTAINVGGIGGNAFFPAVSELKWPPVWDDTKQEMEIVRWPTGMGQPEMQLHIRVRVMLDPAKGIGRQPAVLFLGRMAEEVQRSLGVIEGAARKAGVF